MKEALRNVLIEAYRGEDSQAAGGGWAFFSRREESRIRAVDKDLERHGDRWVAMLESAVRDT